MKIVLESEPATDHRIHNWFSHGGCAKCSYCCCKTANKINKGWSSILLEWQGWRGNPSDSYIFPFLPSDSLLLFLSVLGSNVRKNPSCRLGEGMVYSSPCALYMYYRNRRGLKSWSLKGLKLCSLILGSLSVVRVDTIWLCSIPDAFPPKWWVCSACIHEASLSWGGLHPHVTSHLGICHSIGRQGPGQVRESQLLDLCPWKMPFSHLPVYPYMKRLFWVSLPWGIFT